MLDLTATAASVARRMSFRAAVVALDQLLRRGIEKADVARLLAKGVRRYALRAKAALEFADARSDSVGETLARIVLHQVGAPRPELQHEFRSRDGRLARVDFWFPDHGVVVEFDGATKYRDAALRNGRSPEQVVIDEKVREDWIRADPTVTAFLRFTSTDLRTPAFVAATLRAAGIPAAW